MNIQLKVMGEDLYQRLFQEMFDVAGSFPTLVGDMPTVWTLMKGAPASKPEDLLCSPDNPHVLVVEAHDTTVIENIHAIEDHVHAFVKCNPDTPLVLCPIIMVFQSPAILVGSANFPDIVTDWMFLPVAISDLALRVFCALKRKGLLAIQRHQEVARCTRILSERELQILKLADIGLQINTLAGKLFLSEATIKWHLRNIYAKFNVKNRSGAIARARELGLM